MAQAKLNRADSRTGLCAQGGHSHGPTMYETKEQIELTLRCTDLVSKDYTSESDPFVVVWLKSSEPSEDEKTQKNHGFVKLGSTEAIMDNPNPEFQRSFIQFFAFESDQELKLDVYDKDADDLEELRKHDLIGTAVTTLATLLHTPGQTLSMKLIDEKGRLVGRKKSPPSCVVVSARRLHKIREELSIRLTATGLPSMDFWSKSDPFAEIYRVRDGEEELVYTTEYIKNTKDAQWAAIQTDSVRLCNNEPTMPLIIRVYDYDGPDKKELIGLVHTNLDELRDRFEQDLQRDTGKKQTSSAKYGKLTARVNSQTSLSFTDFVEGGLEMSLMVAIDFTGSNGHPKLKKSLHHGKPENHYRTPYQEAIHAIGNVLEKYDTDRRIPAWGFGAKVDGSEEVQHAFPLTFDEKNDEVEGLIGLDEAYNQALGRLEFSGPTYFQQILEKAIAKARQVDLTEKQQYFTLLILTDGVINDPKQTKDLIVAAANEYLPLSIIIVGIGPHDFTQMNALDADRGSLLDSKGNKSKRDIVQFVPLRKYAEAVVEQLRVVAYKNTDYKKFCKAVVKEIPVQFLSVVMKHNLKPQSSGTPSPRAPTLLPEDQKDSKEAPALSEVLGPRPDNLVFGPGVPEPPLPRGWAKLYDRDMVPYYRQDATGCCQWMHPGLRFPGAQEAGDT